MSRGAVRAGVSVGSNVNPNEHIAAGLAALRAAFGHLTVSSAYRSPSAGDVGAPFLNLAVTFDTGLRWRELRAALKRIEHRQGRERDMPGPPQVKLDLDLVILGDTQVDTAAFSLPAADLVTRAYVLGPLAEIWPDFMHQDTGSTLAQLWRDFDRSGLELEPVDLAFPA